MTPSEKLLREAADYIREHGWIRGSMYDDRGRVCMLGACRAASMSARSVVGALHPAVDALEAVCGTAVVAFNDSHCKSARDAIAALEIAADLCAAPREPNVASEPTPWREPQTWSES